MDMSKYEKNMNEYKYETIIAELKVQILNGSWKPGEQIPSERTLVDMFNVSRITIKKALQILVDEELLIRPKNRRGTFVNEKGTRESLQHVKLIGVAIDDVSDRFGSTLLRGIEDHLWRKKIHTVICNGDRNFRKVKDYFDSLTENNIDGVIFSPVIDESTDSSHNLLITDILQKKKIPFVLIDREIPGLEANFVSSDHYESTYKLTKELIARGHTRILLLKGLSCTSMEEREKGFKVALADAGVRTDQALFIQQNDNRLYRDVDEEEIEKLEKKLQETSDFTAVLALNNRLLNGFLRAMEHISPTRVDEIQIGLHDAYSLEQPRPRNLIQIIQPDYEVGKESARLLLQAIEEPEMDARRIILSSKLEQ